MFLFSFLSPFLYLSSHFYLFFGLPILPLSSFQPVAFLPLCFFYPSLLLFPFFPFLPDSYPHPLLLPHSLFPRYSLPTSSFFDLPSSQSFLLHFPVLVLLTFLYSFPSNSAFLPYHSCWFFSLSFLSPFFLISSFPSSFFISHFPPSYSLRFS